MCSCRGPTGLAPWLEWGSLSGAEELGAQVGEVPHSCQSSPRAPQGSPSSSSSAFSLPTPGGHRVWEWLLLGHPKGDSSRDVLSKDPSPYALKFHDSGVGSIQHYNPQRSISMLLSFSGI